VGSDEVVPLRKLPALAATPLSASEMTWPASALVALVKLTVKPSLFIDTKDAFFWTVSALSKS
jgi:hypothetical protein